MSVLFPFSIKKQSISAKFSTNLLQSFQTFKAFFIIPDLRFLLSHSRFLAIAKNCSYWLVWRVNTLQYLIQRTYYIVSCLIGVTLATSQHVKTIDYFLPIIVVPDMFEFPKIREFIEHMPYTFSLFQITGLTHLTLVFKTQT